MGRYYALNDGLGADVADAIEDHYKPRFAGDELPRGSVGLIVALADKLETLVGMLTSSSERSDIVACYQAGANGFVRKPVDFGDLTEKLQRLQAYWLDVNESIAAG